MISYHNCFSIPLCRLIKICIWATAFKMAASESKTSQLIIPNDIKNVVLRIFLSQKRCKICHDRFNIYLKRLFYICTLEITELKLTTSLAQSDSRDSSMGTIMSFCYQYIKSELMRCVGSFASCHLALSKRLTSAKDSKSILLVSLWANSAETQPAFDVTLFSSVTKIDTLD